MTARPIISVLTARRRELGLTRTDVARRMKCDRQVVFKMESGRHKNNALERLDRYAKAVGLELSFNVKEGV